MTSGAKCINSPTVTALRNYAEATAIRVNHAREQFAHILMDRAKITPDQAREVTQLYIKRKVARLDATHGRIDVISSAYLDRAVIVSALAMI